MRRSAALLASLWTGMLLSGTARADLADPVQLDAVAQELVDAPDATRRAFAARHARLLLRDAGDGALAEETLQIAVPLADRLALPGWRAALEDQAFAVLDPRAYDAAQRALGSTPDLGQMASQVDQALRPHGLVYDLTGRTKSVYGVARKAARKGLRLDEVTDRIGLRLRFATVGECYEALDRLHSHFEPVADEFDDYISRPKPSGYRSLHTALRLEAGVAEVQLRTHAQHVAAEVGDAAHWRYKLQA